MQISVKMAIKMRNSGPNQAGHTEMDEKLLRSLSPVLARFSRKPRRQKQD